MLDRHIAISLISYTVDSCAYVIALDLLSLLVHLVVPSVSHTRFCLTSQARIGYLLISFSVFCRSLIQTVGVGMFELPESLPIARHRNGSFHFFHSLSSYPSDTPAPFIRSCREVVLLNVFS